MLYLEWKGYPLKKKYSFIIYKGNKEEKVGMHFEANKKKNENNFKAE